MADTSRALLRLGAPLLTVSLAVGAVAPASLAPPSAAAASAAAARADGAVALSALKVEKKVAPLGLDVEEPRFSWVIGSGARDVRQESYRLRVATEAEGLDGELVWDSGVVESATSEGAPYDGPALESATGYVWDVEVVTTAGAASGSSTFRTGLLDAGDWGDSAWIGNDRVQDVSEVDLAGASWIHPPYTGNNTPPGYFRQTFTVDPGRTVAGAELVMTGDRGFSAFLNGTQVASGASVDDRWKSAARVRVFPQPGENVLAVRLNNTAKAFGAVVGKLVVRYADGTTEEVVTDDRWLSTQTAAPGWQLADASTSGWVPAAARATYGSGPWGAQVTVPRTTAVDTGMNLDTASWIIPDIGVPSPSNPIPTTLFRRSITVPAGKEVAWAQLAATGDQIFTAYWNGVEVARNTGANNEWQQARAVNLSVAEGENVLALSLDTPGTAQYGGVLARVRIGYTDGTSEDVASDGTFLAEPIGSAARPTGWADVAYDDSGWEPARAQALYRGWVYADRVTVPVVPTGAEALTVDGASWIWTPEATTPVAPAEDRAFRTTLVTPAGKEAVSAEIVITADDSFDVAVNGGRVGRTEGAVNEWQQSHRYEVDLQPDRNVLAVRTTNGPNSPAGLIAKVRVRYDDGSSAVFASDATWKATKQIPADWTDPDLDDSAWATAVVQAAYGSAPWNRGVKDPQAPVRPAPLLRTDFEVDGEVANATVYVAAGGYADVSLNGSPISADVLSPGFTDYDDTVQYVATDVTDQLDGGANALGLELGRGFYGMTGSNVWNWQNPPWHDEPVARAVLEIEYADGSEERVVTDDSWTRHDGPTRFDDLYGGETYDASYELPGFDTPGYDEAGWAPAAEVAGPKGELVNMRQQPIRVTESLPAVEITEPQDGTYVVKFPRVLAGNVQITAEGPAGTTIRYQYGEKLRASGLVNFDNNGGFASGFQTDRFVLAGTGEPETWEPHFSYKGFQYVQVTGWPGDEPPPLSAFTAQAMHTDAERTGSFESSSEVMNGTHEAVVDTLYNNIHGIPTDTPMFEKNGWTGDAAVGFDMFMYNIDLHELFAKWMRDLDETRDAEGAPMVIAPSSAGWGQWGVAPPWHSAYVNIPWGLYQQSGDDRTLRSLYPNLKKYVDLEFDRSADGLVTQNRLGDWVSPEASPAGGNAPEDTRVSGTAYLYLMLDTMARSARHLGEDADAERFAANAATVKEAFNTTFLAPGGGHYRGTGDRGYRQTHNVLAVAFGLTPDAETTQRVVDSIAADVRAKDTHLNTGVLGTKYLLPVLTAHGHADLAHALAVQTTYPSWGYKLEQGATSMWEHWATDARSLGHYFLGTVDDWFFNDVAGIRSSVDTGYRDVTIAPAVTGEMEWAKATLDTPFGPVTSDWRTTGNGDLVLEVDVPVGSTGHVKVPAPNAAAVVEGDGLAINADGVRAWSHEDGVLSLTTGSGHYELRVRADLASFGAVLDRLTDVRTGAADHADAGDLSSADRDRLLAGVDAVTADVEDAVTATIAGDASAIDTALAAALAAARALREETSAATTIERPVRLDLVRRLDRVVAALERAASDRAGVAIAVAPLAGPVLPGTEVAGAVTLTNSGDTVVDELTAEVAVGDWPVTLGALPASVPAGSAVELPFTVRVPASARPGAHDVTATVAFAAGEERLELTTSGPWAQVSSGLEVTGVSAAVTGEGTATATVSVRSTGTAAVDGRVELAVPAGWPATVPSAPVSVPAGGTVTVEVPLLLPRDVVATGHEITAEVLRGDDVLASGTGSLTVALETPPAEGEGATDHVDFGDNASESAHAVLAAPNSGTSTEAGLTRRYAHSLFPGSWYSAEVDVEPGQPFLVRMRETFDKATTKEFNLYVDDVPAGRHTITRTQNSVGWMAHQVLVDGADALAETADGTVRLKFEFPTDATAYDPSIADVWVLPLGDDRVAPLVAPRVEGPAGRDGWHRGPVTVALAAVDDRDAAPAVEVGGASGWTAYAGPLVLGDDGEHVVDYRARDAAGNRTAARSLTVRVDATAPSTTVSVRSGAQRPDRAALEIEARDATSGVATTSYRVDGGDWTALGDEAPVVTGFGEHVVEVVSTDVAGNVEQVRRITVTLADVAELMAVAPPQVSGSVVVGQTLRAGDGTWNTAGVTLTRQWLRDGQPVPGATGATYRLGAADAGRRLAVRVTAAKAGLAPATATSTAVGPVTRARSVTSLRVNRTTVRPGQRVRVRVQVTAPAAAVGGKVRLRLDGKVVRTVRATGSVVTVPVRLRGRGVHRLVAQYAGSPSVLPSKAGPVVVRVRVR